MFNGYSTGIITTASTRNHFVLLPGVAKVSVEAGIAMGWKDILGADAGHVSIEHFGASAGANVLFEYKFI